jgi:hypothetical protein
MNTTNTTVEPQNELNSLIKAAYENTKAAIGFVLDGCFRKHGNVEGAAGSHFTEGWTTQGGVEHALFADMTAGNAWTEVSRNGNILVAEAKITVGKATINAISIDDLPVSAMLRVESLGPHPTLKLVSGAPTEPRETKVVTLIIELDAGKDPDLANMPELSGKAIVASWFPGPALPPSRPAADTKVGETGSRDTMKGRGWRVACL